MAAMDCMGVVKVCNGSVDEVGFAGDIFGFTSPKLNMGAAAT